MVDVSLAVLSYSKGRWTPEEVLEFAFMLEGFKMAMGGMAMANKGYNKGGKVRGCGVAQRGLTKGRMV